jgi:hypothetical protein
VNVGDQFVLARFELQPVAVKTPVVDVAAVRTHPQVLPIAGQLKPIVRADMQIDRRLGFQFERQRKPDKARVVPILIRVFDPMALVNRVLVSDVVIRKKRGGIDIDAFCVHATQITTVV